ncbi:Transcription factor Sox-17-alpha [Halotydeus destructor]|nr:Transcription factor Sox-17-alpha [Halotydeus destructor]
MSQNTESTDEPCERVCRPANAFMLFGRDKRKVLSKKNPRLSNTEISKMLGKQWKALGAQDKGKYAEMSRKLKDEHKERHPEYVYKPAMARQNKAIKRRRSDRFRTEPSSVYEIECDQPEQVNIDHHGHSEQDVNQVSLAPSSSDNRSIQEMKPASDSSYLMKLANNRIIQFQTEMPERRKSRCETPKFQKKEVIIAEKIVTPASTLQQSAMETVQHYYISIPCVEATQELNEKPEEIVKKIEMFTIPEGMNLEGVEDVMAQPNIFDSLPTKAPATVVVQNDYNYYLDSNPILTMEGHSLWFSPVENTESYMN